MPHTKQSILWLAALTITSVSAVRANDYAGAPRPLPQHAARPIETAAPDWNNQQPTVRPLEAPQQLPERYASAHVAAKPAGADEVPRPLQAPAERPLTQKRPMSGIAKTLEGKLPAWASGAASLSIVAGLFVLVLWTARRSASGGPARLPREAVEVLGRAPLAGRQQVHLVRCGHKLLLVSITPTSTETLTEIVDPVEVERLEQLCRQPGQSGNPVRDLLARIAGGSRRMDYFQQQAADELDFGHLSGASERRQESRT